jgi:hypothetical protein
LSGSASHDGRYRADPTPTGNARCERFPRRRCFALVEALSASVTQMRVLQVLKASFPDVPFNVIIEVGALAGLGDGASLNVLEID